MSCESLEYNDKINSIYKIKNERIFVSVINKKLWPELLTMLELKTDLRWPTGGKPTNPNVGVERLRDVLIINLRHRMIYNQYIEVCKNTYAVFEQVIIPAHIFIKFISEDRYDLIDERIKRECNVV